MKKRFTFLVAALMAVTAIWAQTEVDGIYYEILDTAAKTAQVVSHVDIIPDKNGVKSGNYAQAAITIPAEVELEGTKYAVTALADYAFMKCANLAELTLPNTLRACGKGVFNGTSKLTELELPEGLTSIGLWAIQWSGIKKVTIPSTVTSFKFASFGQSDSSGSKLEEIIYNSATALSASIFQNTTTLKQVTCTQATPPNVDANTFKSASLDFMILYVNDAAAVEAYGKADIWKDFGEIRIAGDEPEVVKGFEVDGLKYEVTDPIGKKVSVTYSTADELNQNGATISSLYTFTDLVINNKVTYKEVEYTVTEIGAYALSQCTTLTSVQLPATITKINKGAFQQSYNLATLNLSEGITQIGAWMAQGTKIEELTLPNSLTKVDYGSFGNMYQLKNVTIGTGLEKFSAYLFGIATGSVEDNNLAADAPLATITCLSETPPTITMEVGEDGKASFQNRVLANATLIVPTGKVETYEGAIGWEDFGIITDNTSTSTENVIARDVFIQRGGTLEFFEAQDILVMNVTGQAVYRGVTASYELPQAGVYIVKTGSGSYKVKF